MLGMASASIAPTLHILDRTPQTGSGHGLLDVPSEDTRQSHVNASYHRKQIQTQPTVSVNSNNECVHLGLMGANVAENNIYGGHQLV